MKAHRRGVALSMSRNRMMSDAAEADVLLVNPTHVAVALKYDPAKGAPRVVAKGAGEVAARLRAIAQENRVPMVQDIPLARALHASCELGQEVPAQLFTAVARVLAFVMHLGARGVKGGFHRPGFEPPDVTACRRPDAAASPPQPRVTGPQRVGRPVCDGELAHPVAGTGGAVRARLPMRRT